MTKILRDIIGGKEPTFSARIQQLEATTGKKTIDIELTAEMLGKLSDITKRLNLDPYDTTPEELYSALILKAKEHDLLLRNSYHGKIEMLLSKLNHHPGTVPVPVIKQSVLRSVIGTIPPKKVMSLLGFRSVSSLLKRADIDQVMLGAFMHESVTWHRAFTKKLKLCKTSDMTLSDPRVVVIDKKLLDKTKDTHHLPYVQLAGIVGISDKKLSEPYGWLEFTARAVDGLFYLHQRGVYLKLHRFQSNIIKQLVDLTYLPPSSVTKIASVRIPWSVVYTYISKNSDEIMFSNDGPVDRNDFAWEGAVESLRDIHQQLDVWRMTKITAKPTDRNPVSLNISDIAFNALHGLSYSERTNSALSRLTLDELLSRYFKNFNDKEAPLSRLGI